MAEAQLYRWRDGGGKPSYGSACPVGAKCEIKLSSGGWKTYDPATTSSTSTASTSTSTTTSTSSTTTGTSTSTTGSTTSTTGSTTTAGATTTTSPSLGVFKGHGDWVPAELDAFGTWLGKPVQTATFFAGGYEAGNWDSVHGYGWNLRPMAEWMKAKPGRQLSYALGMFPQGVTLADVAAGKHDAHYVTAANTLAQYGMLGVEIRVGHEMDGNWYPWGAPPGSGKEAAFAGAFRRIVTVMRQAQPTNKWIFVWNPTDLQFTDRAYLERLWPGDDVVDQIGVDCYDQIPGSIGDTYYPSGSSRLARQQLVWTERERRLNILRDMAKAHGKRLQFPEWALVTTSLERLSRRSRRPTNDAALRGGLRPIPRLRASWALAPWQILGTFATTNGRQQQYAAIQ
jgi:Glycosyl hydrolase family 26